MPALETKEKNAGPTTRREKEGEKEKEGRATKTEQRATGKTRRGETQKRNMGTKTRKAGREETVPAACTELPPIWKNGQRGVDATTALATRGVYTTITKSAVPALLRIWTLIAEAFQNK